jgi:hypothetical protein
MVSWLLLAQGLVLHDMHVWCALLQSLHAWLLHFPELQLQSHMAQTNSTVVHGAWMVPVKFLVLHDLHVCLVPSAAYLFSLGDCVSTPAFACWCIPRCLMPCQLSLHNDAVLTA